MRALPLFSWTARERKRVAAILTRDVEHPQTFVRAWALDSLATIAQRQRELVPAVERGLRAFEGSGRKALVTRARHIRARLAAASALALSPQSQRKHKKQRDDNDQQHGVRPVERRVGNRRKRQGP